MRDLDPVLERALDEIADHRRELDLLQRLAEVLLREHRHFGAVLAHVDLLRRATDRVEGVGDGVAVFSHGCDHQIDRAIAELGRQAPHHPDVDEADDRLLGGAEDEDVPGMRVGVEEAVLEDHLDHQPDGGLGDGGSRESCGDRRLDLLPVEELEREHVPARGLAIDLREADVPFVGEVQGEALGVVGLDLEVELAHDRAVELVHETDGRIDLRLGDRALDRRRHHVEELEIARDRVADAGALHLHDHVDVPVRRRKDGAMHLPDRRRGEGLLLEADVDVGRAGRRGSSR